MMEQRAMTKMARRLKRASLDHPVEAEERYVLDMGMVARLCFVRWISRSQLSKRTPKETTVRVYVLLVGGISDTK